jgi:hypothetical protein
MMTGFAQDCIRARPQGQLTAFIEVRNVKALERQRSVKRNAVVVTTEAAYRLASPPAVSAPSQVKT